MVTSTWVNYQVRASGVMSFQVLPRQHLSDDSWSLLSHFLLSDSSRGSWAVWFRSMKSFRRLAYVRTLEGEGGLLLCGFDSVRLIGASSRRVVSIKTPRTSLHFQPVNQRISIPTGLGSLALSWILQESFCLSYGQK